MDHREWIESIEYFVRKGCDPRNLIDIALQDGSMWQWQADALEAHFGL